MAPAGAFAFDGDANLSLYFKLRAGEHADLEAAARTAIAWVETLKATAIAIDPEADLRVEIVNADEGSLIVNAIVRWLKTSIDPHVLRVQKGVKKLPRVAQLALAFAPFSIFTAVPAYLQYTSHEFSEKDHADLEKVLALVEADHGFQERRRTLYRAAERDPSIAALGVKESPGAKPLVMVDSVHFSEAGGLWSEPQADEQERVTTTVVEVVLVKPALVSKPSSWTFEQVGVGQFDAIMRDPDVLTAMKKGGISERLREGIPMKLRLRVREVGSDGSWKIPRGGREIVRVISPTTP